MNRNETRHPEPRSSAFASPAARASARRGRTLRFHRVASGETLTQIAEELYGEESLWVLLYGANEKLIRESGGVRPGLTLYVPFL